MTFFEYELGVGITAVLLTACFFLFFDRDHPVLSFLIAVATVVLVVMPVGWWFVNYFGGYI